MADLGFDYNADDYQPLESREPVPAGDYVAMITDSERKATNDGSGQRLSLTWTIVDGEFERRKIFDGLNLENKSAQAVEISMRQLRSICDATGVRQVKDSAELHDKPCIIRVKVRPAGTGKDGKYYEASNSISAYMPVNRTASAPQSVAAPATRTSAPPATRSAPAMASAGATASATKPWERKR